MVDCVFWNDAEGSLDPEDTLGLLWRWSQTDTLWPIGPVPLCTMWQVPRSPQLGLSGVWVSRQNPVYWWWSPTSPPSGFTLHLPPGQNTQIPTVVRPVFELPQWQLCEFSSTQTFPILSSWPTTFCAIEFSCIVKESDLPGPLSTALPQKTSSIERDQSHHWEPSSTPLWVVPMQNSRVTMYVPFCLLEMDSQQSQVN